MSNILAISDLPPEKLPDFWNDNARINSLYAPFRDGSVNARDWDSKLHFWKSLINTWTHYNKICAFTETELKKWFIKNGRVPACLNVVLNEMHKDQEVQTMEKFMEVPQKTWTGWAFDLTIRKPLKWSFNKVKSTIIAPTDANTKFVHINTIKSLSEEILKSLDDLHRNKLLTLKEFISVTNSENIDVETIRLLLHYLQCQNQIDTVQKLDLESDRTEENPLLIKVALSNTNKVIPISELDIGIYKLQNNEKLILKHIETLEDEKAEATRNAKMYVAKQMRQMAKTCLRKQHELEKRIVKQVNVLENIQLLLSRIGTAETDSKVLESYKGGIDALKNVFKENGLSEDAVSDTMLELNDVLETHDDIQSALSQSVTSIDADLEDELAELLNETSPTQPTSPSGGKKEVENDLEQRLKNLNLPSVPNHTPGSSPVKNLEFS